MLLQHDAIVIVWNAPLVLILLLVVLAAGMPARVRVHLDGGLELELVQDGELAALVAQFDEVSQFDRFIGYRLGQRVVLVASLKFHFVFVTQWKCEIISLDLTTPCPSLASRIFRISVRVFVCPEFAAWVILLVNQHIQQGRNVVIMVGSNAGRIW